MSRETYPLEVKLSEISGLLEEYQERVEVDLFHESAEREVDEVVALKELQRNEVTMKDEGAQHQHGL